MRSRPLISLLLVWMFSIQAIAGVSGGACRHAGNARTDAAVVTTAPDHSQHHQHHGDQATPSEASPSGCGCGCSCTGDCLHACHLAAISAAFAAISAAPEHREHFMSAGVRLPSHTILLLRPPASSLLNS